MKLGKRPNALTDIKRRVSSYLRENKISVQAISSLVTTMASQVKHAVLPHAARNDDDRDDDDKGDGIDFFHLLKKLKIYGSAENTERLTAAEDIQQVCVRGGILAHHACIQGARLYNEDMAFSYYSSSIEENENTKTHMHSIGVLDGHGGIRAATILQGLASIMLDSRKRKKNGYAEMCPENAEHEISCFYESANSLLRDEPSGVVSVMAVCFRDVVVMGWLGDCEGCLFTKDKCSFSSPLVKTVNGIHWSDYAELRYGSPPGFPQSFQKHTLYAQTKPHHLGSSIVLSPYTSFQYSRTPVIVQSSIPFFMYDQGSALGREATVFDSFCEQDAFAYAHYILPRYFDNEDQQWEYEMLKLKNKHDYLHAMWSHPLNKEEDCQGEEEQEARDISCATVDVIKMKIGNATQIVDTRLSKAIQPTRSLGDSSAQNKNVIRECSVMKVDLRDNSSGLTRCLLCSDGMFHAGAFANISRLCSFFIDPLKFFKQYFYHRDQEVTLRLVAVGLLPEDNELFCAMQRNLHVMEGQWKQFDHALAWQSCEESWLSVLGFLKYRHMVALRSSAFRDTYSHVSEDSYLYWLNACEKSLSWFEENLASSCLADQEMDEKILCHAAAHMAVLMGSQDNITLVIACV